MNQYEEMIENLQNMISFVEGKILSNQTNQNKEDEQNGTQNRSKAKFAAGQITRGDIFMPNISNTSAL